MIRTIAVVALGLFLAACGAARNPLTQPRMDALNASWGTTLALAEGYYETCERRLIPSTCRTVVAKMQAWAPLIQKKIKEARAFSRNPQISAIDLIGVAENAVEDLKAYQLQNGVK